MLMRLKLALAASLSLLGQAPAASAALGTVTYFGVVDNTQLIYGFTEPAPDYDLAGLFGGGNLEGDLVEATFVYETNFGTPEGLSGQYDEVNGGVAFDATSPLLSATLTVEQPTTLDLYSYSFTPDYYAIAYTSASEVAEIAYSSGGDQTYTYIDTSGAPTSLTESFSGYGYGGGSYFDPGGTTTGLFDTIVFDTLSVDVSVVPEPQAWTMMVAGLALTGATARSRRRRTQSA